MIYKHTYCVFTLQGRLSSFTIPCEVDIGVDVITNVVAPSFDWVVVEARLVGDFVNWLIVGFEVWLGSEVVGYVVVGFVVGWVVGCVVVGFVVGWVVVSFEKQHMTLN